MQAAEQKSTINLSRSRAIIVTRLPSGYNIQTTYHSYHTSTRVAVVVFPFFLPNDIISAQHTQCPFWLFTLQRQIQIMRSQSVEQRSQCNGKLIEDKIKWTLDVLGTSNATKRAKGEHLKTPEKGKKAERRKETRPNKINPLSWMSRKEREGGKRKLRTRQIRQNKKHRIHDTCREVNHFLSILAIPLLSILLVVFSVPCLIVDIICCDLHRGKQGATHATTRRLRLSGCWWKVVRSACLCPAVLLCCVCGCGLHVVYI